MSLLSGFVKNQRKFARVKALLERLSQRILFSANAESAAVISRGILYILVLAETLISIFWIYVLSGLGDAYALMAAVPYFYLVISYVSMLIFFRLKRFEYFIFTQLVMLLVMPFFMQWVIGGFEASSGLAIWAILSPVGAMMILGVSQSTAWFGLFLGLAAISWQLNPLFAANALKIPGETKSIFFVVNLIGVTSILYVVMRYFQAQKAKVMTALEIEQVRSERLLLNILPKSIAERLKAQDGRIADSYSAATIMFADLVNFTGTSAGMSPNHLVDLLNQVFSVFDALTAQYGLEKIKTIGDAYMVVGGVPKEREDHAIAIADMALNIKQVLDDLSALVGQNLAMRIGINTGPVIAGVIGSSKFSYDLWGDAVNLASRMEQYGVPGEIQVSESTYQQLKDLYIFETRGLIAIKGKGNVPAYLLKSKR